MKATKTELYGYIEGKKAIEMGKINAEISQVRQQIKTMLEEKLLPPYQDIARLANNLNEKYTEYIQNHGQFDNWTYRSYVGNLGGIASVGKNLVRNTLDRIVKHIEHGYFNEESLLLSAEQLKTAKCLLEPLLKKRDDLQTLSEELEATVKGSASGKQAYTNLVALGLDMSGFEKSEARLPVVQKLSVDACLINGGC